MNRNEMIEKVLIKGIEAVKNKETEFEIRFGKFDEKGKFSPSTNEEQFINIFDYVKNFALFKGVEYSLIACHKNGERVSQFLCDPNDNDEFSYPWKNASIIGERIVYKKKIENNDFKELGMRMSLSREIPVTNLDCLYKPENPAIFFKIRKRIIFTHGNIRFDLSVMKHNKNIEILEQCEKTFDVEVEFIESDQESEISQITYLLKQLYNALYQENDVKESYYKLVNKKAFIGCKPETISHEKFDKNEPYAMTLKYDGERHLLYIYNSILYIVNAKLEFTEFQRLQTNDLDGTLIDGEIVDQTFHGFDICFYKNKCVMKENLKTRLDYLADIVVQGIQQPKNVQLKEYIFDDLYLNACMYLDETRTQLTSNGLDGFIFVKINKGYPLDTFKSKESNIALKWKPVNMNTIDFKILKARKVNNDEYEEWDLYCSDKNQTHTLFSYENDKTLSKICIPIEFSQEYNDDDIVECAYDREMQTFFPIRKRNDKTKGNYIKVAKDIFKLILNPFEIENINKQRNESSFFNMRRYHNWIKRILLDSYCQKGGNLLDLACGKGGDIFKWVDNNIRRVKAYDFNPESIEQAEERYKKVINKPTSKNFEYEFFTSDLSTEIIDPQETFDIITCFFAIHYFYRNEETLRNFLQHLRYLKEGGYFVFTTLCSTKLKEIDYSHYTQGLSIKPDNINDSAILGNSIDVYIKDSVLNQETTEFIVDYEFTIELIKMQGFELVETRLFDENYNDWGQNGNYLNTDEKSYSFLNRYYVFRKNKSPQPEMTDDLPKDKFSKTTSLKDLRKYCKMNNIDPSGTKKDLLDKIYIKLFKNK